MKMTMRGLLLSATTLGMACAPQLALAQSAEPDATTSEDVIGNDIIVTASKRSQTLQDTPIAVSVTTAAQIENAQVRDLLDIQTLVPSLRVGQLQSSANTNFIIRGFGNGANNAGIEPSVGVFIDGVYRSRSAAQIGDLPNLERVEVLRGPQSTLFGKNASAGVISIVTQKPQFDFGGSAEVTYGNFNALTAKASVTGPISETVAFSLAANLNKRDGYAQDLRQNIAVNDRNRWGVRGQLLFEASDALSIRLIGDYDKIDENCCIAGNLIAGPTVAITDALAGGVSVDRNNPFSFNIYNNFLSSNKIDNYGGSAQIDYDLGALAVTSITAYRKVNAATNQDSDFTGADLIGRNSQDLAINTFTQELRLTSDFDGPVNFLLGGYYFNENIDQENDIRYGAAFRGYGNALISGATGGALNVALLENTFGALEGAPTRYVNAFFRNGDGLDEAYTLKNTAWSIFGTVDFEATDRLKFTVGGNYTKDRKTFTTNVISTDVWSGLNLDAPQFAPFRNQLLFQGGLAQQVGGLLGLGRSATAAEIGAFAGGNPAAFGQVSAGVQAFATANQNNPAANPLNGLKPLQFLPPFLNVPNSVEGNRTSDGDFSWSLRAAYELTDTLNIYATYATGFKASSINLSRDSRPLAANLAAITTAGIRTNNLGTGSRFAGPEEATVYEFGLKAQWSVAAANIAVFKQEITGFQSNVFTGTGFALANAGKQSTWGVEFDGSVRPVRGLNLTLAVTWLDPIYDSFVNSAFGDISGLTPAGIAALSANLGATFTNEFEGGTKATFGIDYSYESPVQLEQGLAGFTLAQVAALQREVSALNSSLTIALPMGLEFGIWGRNLTNAQYITTLFPSVAQAGSVSGYPNQPRTFGGLLRYKF